MEDTLSMNGSDPTIKGNRSALDSLFGPKSVAVIGATDREGTVGRTVLENLRTDEFHGQVFAVNRLIQVARDEKPHQIVATILLENLAMRALTARHGFEIRGNADMGVVQAALTL